MSIAVVIVVVAVVILVFSFLLLMFLSPVYAYQFKQTLFIHNMIGQKYSNYSNGFHNTDFLSVCIVVLIVVFS